MYALHTLFVGAVTKIKNIFGVLGCDNPFVVDWQQEADSCLSVLSLTFLDG